MLVAHITDIEWDKYPLLSIIVCTFLCFYWHRNQGMQFFSFQGDCQTAIKRIVKADYTIHAGLQCHVQKAYTSLGTSCPNAYTKSLYPTIIPSLRYMHEQSTMGCGTPLGKEVLVLVTAHPWSGYLLAFHRGWTILVLQTQLRWYFLNNTTFIGADLWEMVQDNDWYKLSW